MAMMLRVMCVLLLIVSSTALLCDSIKAPTDPDTKLPIFTVRNQSDGRCVVECDMRVGNRTVLSCATFADGASDILKKAGLSPSTCITDTIEAPGEAPGVSDPEMYSTSCPEFFLWLGWDRGVSRTMGNMRQELLLKSSAAVKAIADGFKE